MNQDNQKIDDQKKEERFPALQINQPIGEIYIAKMTSKQIQDITFFDVRRIEDRDVERYLGIQRPLQDHRVEALKKYVNYEDATFPTAIIIAVDEEHAEYDKETSELVLSNTAKNSNIPDTSMKNLCRVIDGQHRIAGLAGLSEDDKDFDVLVSVFVGMDLSDQAYIFATVNLEQNKVNKSLAYDLYELAHTPSPYKTCHLIAIALDRSKDGPFDHRIKRLGVSTQGRSGETLTQATVVNALVDYISKDPKGDRDLLLKGKKLQKATDKESQELCFRNLFIDGKDIEIAKIVEEYFKAVRSRWGRAWNENKTGTGNILNRTNGFRALMKIFGKIYCSITKPGEYVKSEQFLEFFNRVEVEWDYFTVENFKPGTSGEAALRRFFEEKIFGNSS